jgi:tetratricopeptide (TPR) repeat protein
MEIKNNYVHDAYTAIFNQDFQKAIDFFKKAIRTNPKNSSLFYKLSITYARNNELNCAIASTKEAISLDSNNKVYHIHLQNLLIKKLAYDAKRALDKNEDVSKYIEELSHFIELDPLQVDLRLILGLIFLSQGDYTKADEQMREIIEIQPNHLSAIEYFSNRSETKKDVH